MKSLLLVLGALLATNAGCAQISKAEAARDAQQAHAQADRSFAYASCADGSRIGDRCGLLLARASDDDFRARFQEKHCQGKPAPACDRLFHAELTRWLTRRYFLADLAKINASCSMGTSSCADAKSYELLLLDAHNREVRAELAARESAAAKRRRPTDVRDPNLTSSAAGTPPDVVCRVYPTVSGATTACPQP